MLTDAGPLIALIDAGEPAHARCRAVLAGVTPPLLSTWPAFTEAMYLLGRRAGPPATDALWRIQRTGRLEIADLSARAIARCHALMQQYSNLPMALADASLVALAEERGLRTVFTLDRRFSVYRLNGRSSFTCVPDAAGW